jgi:hypothetical protein
MNTIIASAAALASYLEPLDTKPFDEGVNVIAHGQLHLFEVSGYGPGVSCLIRVGFDHVVSVEGLQKLRAFLRTLQDQPVTIGFANGWVWIKEAIL